MTRTFPRQVVISPQYGAGLATWWTGDLHSTMIYDIVESDTLIQACYKKYTEEQAIEALIAAGFPTTVRDLYWNGWDDAKVVTVYGPYAIWEYDGYENIRHRDDITWRD